MCTLISRGVRIEPGSFEEVAARLALERERRAQFASVLAIVNAIIASGNAVVSSVSQSPGNQQGGDGVSKAIEMLRSILLPEDAENKEDGLKKAKEVLAKEIGKGTLKVIAKGYRKKKRPRI